MTDSCDDELEVAAKRRLTDEWHRQRDMVHARHIASVGQVIEISFPTRLGRKTARVAVRHRRMRLEGTWRRATVTAHVKNTSGVEYKALDDSVGDAPAITTLTYSGDGTQSDVVLTSPANPSTMVDCHGVLWCVDRQAHAYWRVPPAVVKFAGPAGDRIGEGVSRLVEAVVESELSRFGSQLEARPEAEREAIAARLRAAARGVAQRLERIIAARAGSNRASAAAPVDAVLMRMAVCGLAADSKPPRTADAAAARPGSFATEPGQARRRPAIRTRTGRPVPAPARAPIDDRDLSPAAAYTE